MQYWHLEPQKGKKNNKERNRQPKTSLASNMRALSNWGPWVHFLSFFFLILFPLPPFWDVHRGMFSSQQCVHNQYLLCTACTRSCSKWKRKVIECAHRDHLTVARAGWDRDNWERKRGKWEKDLSALIYKAGNNTELSGCIHLQPKSS